MENELYYTPCTRSLRPRWLLARVTLCGALLMPALIMLSIAA